MPKKPDSRPATSLAEANMRRKVEQSTLVRALSSESVELPKVKPPSLEGLEVTVPRAPDITEQALLERFHELRREHATRRQRAVGEPVAEGDLVVVDVLAFAFGKLIPFSIRSDFRTELAPIPALPGFLEGLVGHKVGEQVRVPVKLPASYPAEWLRGVEAQFVVDLKQAWQLTLPEEESPEFLARLGRGKTLEEVMGSIASELEEELIDSLWIEAEQRVLDEVAERTQVELPASLIDEEIRRLWGRTEGRILALRGLPTADQEALLQSWLSDPGQRLEAERRLRVSLGLGALIESQGLKLEEAQIHGLLERVAPQLGMKREEVLQALKTDRAVARTVAETALHLHAVEYVMERARIHFEGAEEGRAQLGKR
ncbi:trigger factor [Hyalangium gracile]|uniref:peptidylprolyl isomerase n=1 Tax=Hyalangium gracile TaxID=394092 RepID=UPI001CC99193|nr:peptidylprolyl isomerase [Hyalangium gracile]